MLRLHVPRAARGLGLVMQAGVKTLCMTGIPFSELLSGEFAIPSGCLAGIDVFLLDGKAVDRPESTLVWSGSRIALAAGLPGIAGLAMKSGSAVRGLRPGITHNNEEGAQAARVPGQGIVEVALFSLALPLLAPFFLERGIILLKTKILPYLRPALGQQWLLHEKTLDCAAVAEALAPLPDETPVFLTAVLH